MPRKPPAASPPPTEDEELDIAIIILRAAIRWKQNDLARASGIGNSSISDYERQKKTPGRKNLRKILQSMGYRESVIEFTRRFLHELRSTQRLAPGESLETAAEMPSGSLVSFNELGMRTRVEQVTQEVGRTTELALRLLLDMLGSRGGPPPEDGNS